MRRIGRGPLVTAATILILLAIWQALYWLAGEVALRSPL